MTRTTIPWTRAEAIAAGKRYMAAHDDQPPPYEALRTENGLPSNSAVTRIFGSYANYRDVLITTTTKFGATPQKRRRVCLKCDKPFLSAGDHVCRVCKQQESWQDNDGAWMNGLIEGRQRSTL